MGTLGAARWCLAVVWIRIFLMGDEAEHRLMGMLSACVSLEEDTGFYSWRHRIAAAQVRPVTRHFGLSPSVKWAGAPSVTALKTVSIKRLGHSSFCLGHCYLPTPPHPPILHPRFS